MKLSIFVVMLLIFIYFTASVTITLSDLVGKGFVDETKPLQPAAGMKGDMGSLRLKARYVHEVIMPEDEFTSLKEVSRAG